MLSLNGCGLQPKQVVNDIISAKQGDRGIRLQNLLPTIESRYDDLAAARPPFVGLVPAQYSADDSDALDHCYSSRTAPLDRLVAAIRRSQSEFLRYLCPYCLIDRSTEVDHYLPRNIFPEYAVHSENLIPICDTCNRSKSAKLSLSATRNFLHFYLDPIPAARFLFARVNWMAQTPIVEFRIDGTNLDAPTTAALERHFSSLRLLERYSDVSNLVFSDAASLLHTHGGALTDASAKAMLLAEAERWARLLGSSNYWKTAAFTAMAEHDAVVRMIVTP